MNLTGSLPYQTYQGQPGTAASNSNPNINSTAFSPQHQMNQPPFLLSPDSVTSATQAQFPHQDFYNVVSPTQAIDNNAMLGQISPVSGHWQPQVTRQGSLPLPTEEELQPPSAGSDRMEYWHSDDEASMAESEDEEAFDDVLIAEHLESNDLGIQVARRAPAQADVYGTRIRTFEGSVDENILDTYHPSSTNSPLNDAQTAAIFWYFVNVTAPSMSLYERHPFDSAKMFQGQPVPKASQHIWTCELSPLEGKSWQALTPLRHFPHSSV